MSRRRFIADESSADSAALTGANAEHLGRVLRARLGQEFEIVANGRVRLGTITSVSEQRVEFELGAELPAADVAELDVLLAVFKFDRFEWAVEKATELGVAKIVPVIARRTESHLAQSAVKRAERWRRISHEASQQSRRVSPPQIGDPVKLKEALGIKAGLKVLCAETEERVMFRDVIAQAGMPVPHSVALAVGPEGGWAEDELKLFESAGWVSASLGPTILRAETAVVAAVAVTTLGVAFV
jgi:16S rRNA (uracil1498-N3)-methyltransferase